MTSGNWGGYAAGGATGSFQSVRAAFVVPTLTTCGAPETSYASFWAGIDGWGNGTVEQDGVDATCSGGAVSYFAWYEMYPAMPVIFPGVSVHAGDSVTASVNYATTGTYTLQVTDATSRTGGSIAVSAPGLANSTAECIAEDPGVPTVPYSNYPSVTFTGCLANGTAIGLLTPNAIDTVAAQGEVEATTGPLTANTAFTVTRVPFGIVTTTLPPPEKGLPYSAQVGATGGTGPYTWSLSSGSLPPGLGLSASGLISGTPTAVGTSSFVVKVIDGASVGLTVVLSVTVGSPQTVTFTSNVPSPVVVGSPDYRPTATASSGLLATITLDQRSDGCTLVGGAVRFSTVGTCVLDADQGGNATYGAASEVQQVIAVAVPPARTGPLGTLVVGMASLPSGYGYWLVGARGDVSAHGAAQNYGSMAGHALNAPIAHIVPTPDGYGYWLVASDGGAFAFGDAGFYGSMGGQHLNAPVVDMAPTPDGGGYWLVASDGGIFAFGDAVFQGSMGGVPLNRAVVGIAADDRTGGYWEVASDGGIFSFGAPFFGSTGGIRLNQPILSMAPTADGMGYWFVAPDGGIFGEGDAAFKGSFGGAPLRAPVVGMAADMPTGGYWMVTADGSVYSFWAVPFGSG